MLNLKIFLLSIIFCFLCAFSCFAANNAVDLKTAREFLAGGQPWDALTLLQKNHDSQSSNAQEWFLMALAAKACQRPVEASSYLEKVIEIDPKNAGRAKLELAYLTYSLGDVEKAKLYLNEVKASGPPTRVGENIDRFMQLIDTQAPPKSWRLTTSLGWMYDSNANAGPDTDSVLMYGLPFVLSDDAKDNEDTAWLCNIGFDYNKIFTDDIAWQFGLYFSLTDYASLDNLDSFVLSGSTGPSFRVTNRFGLSVPLVFDRVRIGHEDSYYYCSYGVAPQLHYALTEKLSFNLGSVLSKKDYHNRSDRNSENYQLSPSLNYQIDNISFARTGLTLGIQNSGLSYQDNDLWGLNAMYGRFFWDIIQVTLSLSYFDTDYTGKEEAYSQARHDKTTRFGMNITYHIKLIGTDLVSSLYRTINHSNLDIYEYDRDQLSFFLRKSF